MSSRDFHLHGHGPAAIETLKVLASRPRLQILELLSMGDMSVSELAQALRLPQPSVTVHVKKLEEANLIECRYQPGQQGFQKMSSRRCDRIFIDLPAPEILDESTQIEIAMPIGVYRSIRAEGTCGLINDESIIGLFDDPASFLDPQHVFAQLIWFSHGWVEYVFPNRVPAGVTVTGLEISVELCSEAPCHNADWPSDITLWINGVEIGTWTCPGDFGGKRGRFTPPWWRLENTQYGLLKTWRVLNSGSLLDGEPLSDVTLADLRLPESLEISVRFGIKDDAVHRGGLNLFGAHMGNYAQDLTLRLHCAPAGAA